jgi:hypothetical protein
MASLLITSGILMSPAIPKKKYTKIIQTNQNYIKKSQNIAKLFNQKKSKLVKNKSRKSKKEKVMHDNRVSIIRIFIRIFFLENYSLFEYFLTEYSNNNFLLNKPYKNVNFQTIFPKKILKILKTLKNPI